MKFLVVALMLIGGKYANACSCMDEYPSAPVLLRASHSVFIGIPDEDSRKVSRTLQKTKFTVVKNFKNAGTKNQVIFSNIDDGGNCGI